MTTCPSGVDYGHLVEIGREKLDEIVPRGFFDRMMRGLLAATIPHAARFHALLRLGQMAKPFRALLPAQLRAGLGKLPSKIPALDRVGATTQTFGVSGKAIRRVALLAGCAQRALDPKINASTIRVLNRLGVEVVVRSEAHCCGALVHHIGATDKAHTSVKAALLAWQDEINTKRLDAIIVNASGCGTMVKDYGHLLADDPALAGIAADVSAMTMDITQLLAELGIEKIVQPAASGDRPKIAYHSACSLQHGQKIHDLPLSLLRRAGFTVTQPLNPHLCCGSAGVYNILQAEMADGLRERKLESLNNTGAIAVAAGNIGCITQLDADDLPVRHTVQFIDWASGGPSPL
jgi:glycolate oxidase iron-sulfur subunit